MKFLNLSENYLWQRIDDFTSFTADQYKDSLPSIKKTHSKQHFCTIGDSLLFVELPHWVGFSINLIYNYTSEQVPAFPNTSPWEPN